MEKLYILDITAKQLKYATDMLRFDSCYQAEVSKDGSLFHLYCASYTPARWASFSANPSLVRTDKVTVREWTEKHIAATGFLWGLRFAQHFHGDRLVEGNIVNINLK